MMNTLWHALLGMGRYLDLHIAEAARAQATTKAVMLLREWQTKTDPTGFCLESFKKYMRELGCNSMKRFQHTQERTAW